ncbi:MAG: hypothetical protein LBC73_09865 [Oscillospiraceae bacterium]|jgi:hypothetical protein|nr:hypothetical protein [Oscillospiraceae bacterium]
MPLKNKSGLSLIFVTGIMFLLLGVGTSVLAAASATVGAGMRQNEYNRAMALSNSIHRSIEYSLNNMSAEANSLGYRIALYLHEEGEAAPNINITGMTLAGDDTPEINFHNNVVLSFTKIQLIEGGPVGYMPPVLDAISGAEIIPAQARIPYTVEFNVRMVVTVQINTGQRLFVGQRLITTQAIYDYTGGVLSDEGAADAHTAAGFPNEGTFNQGSNIYDPLSFYGVGNYGVWTLVDFIVGEN